MCPLLSRKKKKKKQTTSYLTFQTRSHSITLIRYSFQSNESDLNVCFCFCFAFLYTPKKLLKLNFIDFEILLFNQHLGRTLLYANGLVSVFGHM